MVGAIPLVGKTSNLRSLYKFSPGKFLISLPFFLFPLLNYLFSAEIKKKTPEKGVKFTEPEPKRQKITIKSSQTAGVESAKEKNVAEKDAAKAAEEQRKAEERRKKSEEEKKRKAEEDKKSEEAKRKKAEEEKRAEVAKRKRASELEKEKERKKAMEKPVNVSEFEVLKGPERRQEPEVARPTHPAHAEAHDRTKIVLARGRVGMFLARALVGLGAITHKSMGRRILSVIFIIKAIPRKNVAALPTKLLRV
ncbi:putative igA-specific serine endopeptidase [Helianthus annuus]|nr:putative igA-specific serine endopeptidase [Helianthus annuus]